MESEGTGLELESFEVEPGPVPVSPFPEHLRFHSLPGSPSVLYLNFEGEVVTGTHWNQWVGRSSIPALPFSTDSDYSTYSEAEQLIIFRVWQRVAEDFSAFNINVTTERPEVFTPQTAVALITRNTDSNGDPNPSSTAGGVAYVNVFGSSLYDTFRPAWIYHNRVSNREGNIAEVVSHEIGHNLGLTHDGQTDGTQYYKGHGSGQTSWYPIMGNSYSRNVSQWSKGDYYLANNTQDDVAIITAKVGLRPDDHGDTLATATPLLISEGGGVSSTTPQTDPHNFKPFNKGIIERETDVDVFSFVTGTGPISLTVSPWVSPAGTRGNNLDVSLELYDESGSLLMADNPPELTAATIATNLNEGRYYLYVRNTAAGDPFSSTPTGYTAYGSLGQYFINGTVTEDAHFNPAPIAELAAQDLHGAGHAAYLMSVTYYDDTAIDVASLGNGNVRVTGPNGYDRLAAFVQVSPTGNGSPRTATYGVSAPDQVAWAPADNGSYTVWMEPEQVRDIGGSWVPAGELGGFDVSIPLTIYTATMNADPGWTLEPQWEYGAPAYAGDGPTGGFTGDKIIAYNLSGNYPNNLEEKHATTPPINTVGSVALSVRFQRWLRVHNHDVATISVSTNGTDWVAIWSDWNVYDEGWQSVQHALPEEVAGSPSLQLRWSLRSNHSQHDIGWNIDDVELLADGSVDTTPPAAHLNASDVNVAGGNTHVLSVTYTDETAVRVDSLGAADLRLSGPNGYDEVAAFLSADLPFDGSPITAQYAVTAPGGSWEAPDNGTYTVTLQAGAVADILNNATPETVLGSFDVSIEPGGPAVLEITPSAGFETVGPEGGPFTPASVAYTLTNAGEVPLTWTAYASEAWLGLSATSGELAPGSAELVTISMTADTLALPFGAYQGEVVFVNQSAPGNSTSNLEVGLTVHALPTVALTVSVNQGDWGSVTPSTGTFPAGSVVELSATPLPYFQFEAWSGDASGDLNPLLITLNEDTGVEAHFGEIRTDTNPTPHWWLAEHGYTSNQEHAVTTIGANGLALWQSYIAGLNPNDPDSRLHIGVEMDLAQGHFVLSWETVPNRLYNLYACTLPLGTPEHLPGAQELPWTVNSYTNVLDPNHRVRFFGLSVHKP